MFRFIENLQQPDSFDLALADLNEDGVIDVRDAQLMSNMLGY